MKHAFTTIVILTIVGMLCVGTVLGADGKRDRDLLRSRTAAEMQTARASINRAQATAPAAANKTLTAVVYVNDDWAGLSGDPDGVGGPATAMGVDAFAAIQEGIDAVDAGGTVNVYPGDYSETAANRYLYDATGPYQFGLFFGAAKPGVTVRGVDAAGIPISSAANAVANVTTNSTANFGPDGIWIEADNATVAGLKLLDNVTGNNKAIEIIGDNATIAHCWIDISGGGSIYINDWRYDAVNAVAHVTSYTVDGNIMENGGSVDLANGAGMTGPASGRVIKNNTFNITPVVNWAVVSFNGSGTGVAWFVNSVGGAVITGNTFNGGAQHIVRARGNYDNAQFDWASYWTNNTYSRKVMFGPTAPAAAGTFSYVSGAYTMNNVRHIAGLIQQEIDYAQTGDIVAVGAGTYAEDVNINKQINLRGAGIDQSVIQGVKTASTPTLNFGTSNTIAEGFTVTRDGNNVTDWTTIPSGKAGVNFGQLTTGNVLQKCKVTGNRNGVYFNNSQGNIVRENVITFNRTGIQLVTETSPTQLSRTMK